MKRRRVIASMMLCLLLTGTTLAAADQDRGRGDRKNDRGSKSEEKSSKEPSRRERTVRRGDDRQGRVSDRPVVESRRQPSRVQREPYRVQREPYRVQREPSRVQRDPSWAVRDRSPRQVRTNEHVVSRTRTPAGWNHRAVRGRAQYATWDGYRAHRWQSEHRTWRARGGYDGYWIPEQRYRVVFGSSHRFRVDRCPVVVVSGYPRFYYGGYWVTFIDPWPEYWDDYWFAQDDCYIVHDYDGYYLTNVRHPGVRIAVSFTLG